MRGPIRQELVGEPRWLSWSPVASNRDFTPTRLALLIGQLPITPLIFAGWIRLSICGFGKLRLRSAGSSSLGYAPLACHWDVLASSKD